MEIHPFVFNFVKRDTYASVYILLQATSMEVDKPHNSIYFHRDRHSCRYVYVHGRTRINVPSQVRIGLGVTERDVCWRGVAESSWGQWVKCLGLGSLCCPAEKSNQNHICESACNGEMCVSAKWQNHQCWQFVLPYTPIPLIHPVLLREQPTALIVWTPTFMSFLSLRAHLLKLWLTTSRGIV